jgi:mitochondrial import inner membrane translocase subunit TIM17
LFNSFDCTLIQLRRKEDPWNAIMSGALTGGCLSVRGGPKMILTSAIFGGLFLAVIEGVVIGMNRMMAQPYRPPMASAEPQAAS